MSTGLVLAAPELPVHPVSLVLPLEQKQVLAQADAFQLHAEPLWPTLLHYNKHPITRQTRSLSDDAAFFYSPQGRTNPEAELKATLLALMQPSRADAPDEHPQCQFPARYFWLKSRLNEFQKLAVDQPCPRFDAWAKSINPAGATLIFPSAYVNSPASMFGHTLLRIDAVGQTEATRLLAYTINYAANANTNDGISFAIKGLLGIYPGLMSSAPYYAKVREYSDLETRDIWEYKLNLTADETLQLLRHAWEIGKVRFDYWFFDENCSFLILRLLDVARPGLTLSQQFPFTAIPADTVKAVVKASENENTKLVSEVSFRPSTSTELNHRAKRLSPEEIDLAIAVAEGRIKPEQINPQQIGPELLSVDQSAEKAAEVLEFADRLVTFRGYKGKLEAQSALARMSNIQSTRSRFPKVNVGSPEVPVRPELAHDSGRVGLGLGSLGGESTLFADFRPSYHDLLDPEKGYARGAQIRFGDVSAYKRSSEDWKLNRLLLVDIISVSPQQQWNKTLSWKVRFGWERTFGNEVAAAPLLAGGPGLAWGQGSNLITFAFLENQLVRNPKNGDQWLLGTGPLLGALWDVNASNRVQAEVLHQWYSDEGVQRSKAQISWRKALNRQTNLIGSAESLHVDSTQPNSFTQQSEQKFSIGFQRYF
ncbi:MAG: DUF4105 domain-containing protein [Limnobacter sp.]|nr:DUF4105 domain-containing protein [Limnobacter sp.]